ncbi:MAG: hypothetical protein DDT18_00975 [Actinobacteria bacterium]|nr:hypothetical protein [Actinomycetota bacterium]
MLNILTLASDNENYGIAAKLRAEGHIVKFYSPSARANSSSKKGEMPQIVTDWKPHIPAADLILLLSGLRGAISELAEGRRIFGDGAVESILNTPRWLERLSSLIGARDFDEGFKLTIGGWFSGKAIRFPYYIFHTSKLFEGGRGITVEGMGCVLIPVQDMSDRLIGIVREFNGILSSFNFSSIVEFDVIINETDISLKSIRLTLRNGNFQALTECFRGSVGNMIYTLPEINGNVKPSLKAAISVGLSLPPWPYSLDSSLAAEDVLEVQEGASRHFWPSLNSSFLGYVTAGGLTVREAQRRAYRTVKNIVKSTDIQYRGDVDSNVESSLAQLREWNWIAREEGGIDATKEGKV